MLVPSSIPQRLEGPDPIPQLAGSRSRHPAHPPTGGMAFRGPRKQIQCSGGATTWPAPPVQEEQGNQVTNNEAQQSNVWATALRGPRIDPRRPWLRYAGLGRCVGPRKTGTHIYGPPSFPPVERKRLVCAATGLGDQSAPRPPATCPREFPAPQANAIKGS